MHFGHPEDVVKFLELVSSSRRAVASSDPHPMGFNMFQKCWFLPGQVNFALARIGRSTFSEKALWVPSILKLTG